MPHSPRHQAARQRGAHTGERFEQAWEGIRQDQCDYQRPIPDAATLAQQRLEAAVVYALVEGFRHEWGVVAGRELEVLTLLLPYYDCGRARWATSSACLGSGCDPTARTVTTGSWAGWTQPDATAAPS